MLIRFFLLILVYLIRLSSGSVGDRSGDFLSCRSLCYAQNCSSSEKEIRWDLKLLGWTCLEDCQYHCMHQVTTQDIIFNRPIRQFFGKWPFVRILGVQEPASVLFSVLNGIGVFVGYMKFRQKSPKIHSILQFQFLVNINAMVWSTIFHTRDLYWTEKMDYFSALSLIIVGLVVQFVRISGPDAVKWHVIYGCAWMGFLCCHVTYLTMFSFDYGYNMIVCASSAIVYTAVWTVWCAKNRIERPYVLGWAIPLVLITSSSLLELIDFAPIWWMIDAHSLWHLSTIPLGPLWYRFLTHDALYEAKFLVIKQA